MSTASRLLYHWNTMRWPRVERKVFQLQKRLYRAAQRGEYRKVRRLQKRLLRSHGAKLFAARQVTPDHQGKKTPGVDGMAALTPPERLALVAHLQLDGAAAPVRRVDIPKPGTREQRPLGLPIMVDRVQQSLVTQALEAEWAARFEPHSDGFRPGRKTWEASGAIYVQITQQPKWVLAADIAKCLDRMDHDALLRTLNAQPTLRRQITSGLQAGGLDKGDWQPTDTGTPQGGPASPLLANVALHGLDERLQQAFPGRRALAVIRYADDLVVLHPDREVIEPSQTLMAEHLHGMGLALKPSKTRMTHTWHVDAGEAGFDCLGFTMRQYPTKAKRGDKTIIKPSRTAMEHHKRQIVEVVRRHRADRQGRLIEALNPVIRGWSHYFSPVCRKETFEERDVRVRQPRRAWSRFRHPNKPRNWG